MILRLFKQNWLQLNFDNLSREWFNGEKNKELFGMNSSLGIVLCKLCY